MSQLGNWIKTNRKERGWSLRELAKQLDDVCTFSYLDQLEKDVRGKKGNPLRPDEAIVAALARVFNTPLDEVRVAAGYAPIHIPAFHPPETLSEFLSILEQLGVELQNFHAPPFDDSPEFYHNVLRDLSRFLMFTLTTPPSRTYSIGDDEGEKPDTSRRDDPPKDVAHFPGQKRAG